MSKKSVSIDDLKWWLHEQRNGRTKIFQNEATGDTICIYENCWADSTNFIDKRTDRIWWNPQMPGKIMSRTKRVDPDEWSAEEGRRIAYRKNDAKHQKYFQRDLKSWIETEFRKCMAVSPELTKEVIKEKFGVEVK